MKLATTVLVMALLAAGAASGATSKPYVQALPDPVPAGAPIEYAGCGYHESRIVHGSVFDAVGTPVFLFFAETGPAGCFSYQRAPSMPAGGYHVEIYLARGDGAPKKKAAAEWEFTVLP